MRIHGRYGEGSSFCGASPPFTNMLPPHRERHTAANRYNCRRSSLPKTVLLAIHSEGGLGNVCCKRFSNNDP